MILTARLDVWWYRAALWLFPPAFRREFGFEMTRDFEEARAEADGLWRFRAYILRDLAASVAGQWLGSRWPVVAVAALMAPILTASALLRLLPAGVKRPLERSTDAEMTALVVMVTVVVLIIASTITFTLWLSYSLAKTRRQARRALRG